MGWLGRNPLIIQALSDVTAQHLCGGFLCRLKAKVATMEGKFSVRGAKLSKTGSRNDLLEPDPFPGV